MGVITPPAYLTWLSGNNKVGSNVCLPESLLSLQHKRVTKSTTTVYVMIKLCGLLSKISTCTVSYMTTTATTNYHKTATVHNIAMCDKCFVLVSFYL